MAQRRGERAKGPAVDPGAGSIVTPEDLRKGSESYHKEMQRHGVEIGAIPDGVVPVPGMQGSIIRPQEEPTIPQQAESKGNGQKPEPIIPEAFVGGKAVDADEKSHPLLSKLENDFGFKKLTTKEVTLAGYTWTFRPMNFRDFEWVGDHAEGETQPSLSVTQVAVSLAAVNRTPVYELFDINTLGRNIKDPLNPPPDIKYEGAEYMLNWLRTKLGMWEVVGKLDEQIDILFEEDRAEQFPFYEQLASPIRRQILELSRALRSALPEQNGKHGEGASQSAESSQLTGEQENSGTTQTQQNSSSTGGQR